MTKLTKEEIKVKKQGDYTKVFVNGENMATYSHRTRKTYGATKYFKYLDEYLKEAKKKSETSYICPSCKKEQTSVILWQTCSVAYEKDLKTGDEEYQDTVGGDFEAWACPECGEDLPEETTDKLGLF